MAGGSKSRRKRTIKNPYAQTAEQCEAQKLVAQQFAQDQEQLKLTTKANRKLLKEHTKELSLDEFKNAEKIKLMKMVKGNKDKIHDDEVKTMHMTAAAPESNHDKEQELIVTLAQAPTMKAWEEKAKVRLQQRQQVMQEEIAKRKQADVIRRQQEALEADEEARQAAIGDDHINVRKHREIEEVDDRKHFAKHREKRTKVKPKPTPQVQPISEAQQQRRASLMRRASVSVLVQEPEKKQYVEGRQSQPFRMPESSRRYLKRSKSTCDDEAMMRLYQPRNNFWKDQWDKHKNLPGRKKDASADVLAMARAMKQLPDKWPHAGPPPRNNNNNNNKTLPLSKPPKPTPLQLQQHARQRQQSQKTRPQNLGDKRPAPIGGNWKAALHTDIAKAALLSPTKHTRAALASLSVNR